MTHKLRLLLTSTMLLSAGLLLVACATPEARIRQNQALFDSFPLEAQELIREGEIDIGFTEEMVEMARGVPDRKYTRRTVSGTVSIWGYTDHYTATRREMVSGRFRVRDSRTGQIHHVNDSVWVEVPVYHEFDRFRVEFGADGRVQAIETTI